ncbi:alpha/beta fold hydrolase [Mumia zhuanghuii]|uniref:Alpha/beta fold hydrolase n=1 Tax=Mumia zhuanghuii TaxID=2585211 RepID=A0A5C4MDE1_9ACTN|nr:alpha/beta fold hydrolase [Mumia zhuanghuii]TNC35960.1 alpha/beta fold hydrolase [Mumia zhuanghuii]
MAGDSAPLSVPSAGVTLAVRRSGTPTGPTIVLLHGFPDNHHVWDKVVPLLDDFDVVAYDVRGAGGSTAPAGRDGYRIERLVDDLVAVLDAVRPDGGAVHLVGHDWGSVQLWAAVFAAGSDPRMRGRIASFVSISGPDLRLYGAFLRETFADRRFGVLLGQLARSWYIAAFQVPAVPELVIRRATGRVRRLLARSQHLEDAPWSGSLARDGANGVDLYRANAFRAVRTPAPPPTDVPVLLVVPLRDRFLSPALYDNLPRSVRDLQRREVDAGHWMPWSEPELLAALVREHVGARQTPERLTPPADAGGSDR